MVRGWLRETAGGLPAPFWFLWIGTLINRLGGFVLIFLAVYLTKERGLSDIQAGLVLGLWSTGGAVGTVIGGVLADRWGRRPTLLLANLGAATMMVVMGLSRELWLFGGSALLLGMFADAIRPAFAAMMVDVVPVRDRVRAFSLNYWAINVGFACAALLGGFAARIDYLLLFVLDAVTTLTTAAVILIKVPETHPDHGNARPGSLTNNGLGSVLSDPVFVLFAFANLLAGTIFLQHSSMLPIAMTDEGLSPATYGWVISLNGVLIVVGQLFIPKLIAGHDRAHVLAVGCVILGTGFGLTAVAGSAWIFALTVLVWTAGEMLHSPSAAATVAELAPLSKRGRYQGMFTLSWSVAGFIGPTAGGLVRETLGNAALWLGCSLIAAVAAALHLASAPSRARRAAALSTAALPGPEEETSRPADPRAALRRGSAGSP